MILSVSTSLFAEKGFYLLGTMTGQGINDCYYHVAGIGDVNGDGFDDAMVGASAGQYAHLFLGSADFDTIPDVIFKNMYVGTICGDDWNCDGYSDIAIGDPLFSLGNREILESGKVWIYFGGPQIDTIPDLELVVGDVEEFTGWYYRFGSSITGGGDVNGDGYHDLIVGTPNDDYDAHGRVYIYFGGPQMDDQYDVLLEGEGALDMFGTSIDIAGDINQDGYDDVIIGAPQSLTRDVIGKAYLVYGGSDINLDNANLFAGDSTLYYFGRYVSGLGDINIDGLSDFAIMADKYLRIISGNNLKIISEIVLEKNWGTFYSVTGKFDMNNDDVCDIAVSIQEVFNDQCYNKLQLYKGGTEIDTIPDYEVILLAYGYLFNISFAGDINDDGDKDIIIGDTFEGRGKAYIYSYGEINLINEEKQKYFNNIFQINQNYPNPFNAETRLSYYIPNDGDVGVNIYDCQGRKVRSLISERQYAGNYSIIWDGKNDAGIPMPSGIYFYQLISHGNDKQQVITKKMVYLK